MTRRGALGRGSGASLLVCSFKADPRAHGRQEERLRALGVDAVRPVPARPADPAGAPAVAQRRSARGVRDHDEAGTADILPGPQTPILGYNGLFPGPTIKATRGREVQIRQINQSGASSTCTCTAASRRRSSTGTRTTRSPTATERLYKYPNVARSATLWYHDHAHGETAQTLFAGPGRVLPARRPERPGARPAAGRLRRAADDPGPLVQRRRVLPLPVRPRPRLPRRHDPGQRRGRAADEGRAAPYRLRFLNASNARAYELELGNGRKMIQIGSDGGLLPASRSAAHDPAGAGRARRRDRRLPPVRRRLEGDPAQRHRRGLDDAR